jgi:hypothetical protein
VIFTASRADGEAHRKDSFKFIIIRSNWLTFLLRAKPFCPDLQFVMNSFARIEKSAHELSQETPPVDVEKVQNDKMISRIALLSQFLRWVVFRRELCMDFARDSDCHILVCDFLQKF